jgi:hypothetical protein
MTGRQGLLDCLSGVRGQGGASQMRQFFQADRLALLLGALLLVNGYWLESHQAPGFLRVEPYQGSDHLDGTSLAQRQVNQAAAQSTLFRCLVGDGIEECIRMEGRQLGAREGGQLGGTGVSHQDVPG